SSDCKLRSSRPAPAPRSKRPRRQGTCSRCDISLLRSREASKSRLRGNLDKTFIFSTRSRICAGSKSEASCNCFSQKRIMASRRPRSGRREPAEHRPLRIPSLFRQNKRISTQDYRDGRKDNSRCKLREETVEASVLELSGKRGRAIHVAPASGRR